MFNTAEGWSRDVSEEIALALMEACAKEGVRKNRRAPLAVTAYND
jgi:hypothetical protein